MNKNDLMLKAFPLVAAPMEGDLEPCAEGMRYIAASNGMFREIKLPWIRVVHKIGDTSVRLPYGKVTPTVRLECNDLPKSIWKDFREAALRALPNEYAAAIIWNREANQWRLVERVPVMANPHRIQYVGEGLTLNEGDFIVVDLHSHGTSWAFFSSLDDKDDAGSMRFSGVIGDVEKEMPTFVLRLNMPGAKWDAFVSQNGTLEVNL